MQKITFSEILRGYNSEDKNPANIKNKTIIFDSTSYRLENAFAFEGCEFVLKQESEFSNAHITTTECFRVTNCRLSVSITLWGEKNNYVVDFRKNNGPNVFFENCIFDDFTTMPQRDLDESENIEPVCWKPSLQVSGLIGHCRIGSVNASKLELSISQCLFSRLDILGKIASLQLTEIRGEELYLENLSCNFLFINNVLQTRIDYVGIDLATVRNLTNILKSTNIYDPIVFTSYMRVFDCLLHKREGKKIDVMNDGICYFNSLKKSSRLERLKTIIIYRFFKNFYSVRSMLQVSLAVVVLFGIIYSTLQYLFTDAEVLIVSGKRAASFLECLYFSAITFTTVGYGDIQPVGWIRFFASLEGYIGIFMVLMTSFVFSKKYSNY